MGCCHSSQRTAEDANPILLTQKSDLCPKDLPPKLESWLLNTLNNDVLKKFPEPIETSGPSGDSSGLTYDIKKFEFYNVRNAKIESLQLTSVKWQSVGVIHAELSITAEILPSTQWGNGDWGSSSAMCGDGHGGVFVITSGAQNLWHAYPGNKGGEKWGDGNWGDGSAAAMCSDGNGGVFVITPGAQNLWHAHPGNKGGENWGSNWGDGSRAAMCSDGNGGVFVITPDTQNLWHAHPGNKSGENWGSNWGDGSDAAMCSDGNGGVFVITPGTQNLWHAHPGSKSGEKWGDGNWGGDLCSDGNGGVFVFTYGAQNLWHAYPGNKGGEKWGDGNWGGALCSDGNGGVFVITDGTGTLWHATDKFRYGVAWKYDGYDGSDAMVSDGKGGVFIIRSSDQSLWHETPEKHGGTVQARAKAVSDTFGISLDADLGLNVSGKVHATGSCDIMCLPKSKIKDIEMHSLDVKDLEHTALMVNDIHGPHGIAKDIVKVIAQDFSDLLLGTVFSDSMLVKIMDQKLPPVINHWLKNKTFPPTQVTDTPTDAVAATISPSNDEVPSLKDAGEKYEADAEAPKAPTQEIAYQGEPVEEPTVTVTTANEEARCSFLWC